MALARSGSGNRGLRLPPPPFLFSDAERRHPGVYQTEGHRLQVRLRGRLEGSHPLGLFLLLLQHLPNDPDMGMGVIRPIWDEGTQPSGSTTASFSSSTTTATPRGS